MPSHKARYDSQRVNDSPDFRILLDEHAAAGRGQDTAGGGGKTAAVERNDTVNLACAYTAEKSLHLVRLPMPRAESGEVLLHVRATGICGSDVHFWKHGHIGPFAIEHDTAAGHESSAEVIGLGEGVTSLQIGDRVALEPGIPCGECKFCMNGRYNGCTDMVFKSAPGFHGTLSRYITHPAQWCHKIPSSISYEEAALMEPLSVALHGVERANIRLGDPVLICGAGPIGLLALLCAHAAGACPIIITDISASRLAFAKTLVPDVITCEIDTKLSPQDQGKRIAELVGEPLKAAIECTGVQSSITTAVYSVEFGGMVMSIGVGGDMDRSIPFQYISAMEIDLRTVFRYTNTWPRAIRLVSSGRLNIKPLVTHRFELERAIDAFNVAGDYKSGAIKTQIVD